MMFQEEDFPVSPYLKWKTIRESFDVYSCSLDIQGRDGPYGWYTILNIKLPLVTGTFK